MLVMLCTRCQQREAVLIDPSAELRAKAEEIFGAPWPLAGNLCKLCIKELSQDPEYKARFEEFNRAISAKYRKDLEKMKQNVRSTVLKLLDFADEIAGRM